MQWVLSQFFGFLLGILGSLAASAIWKRLPQLNDVFWRVFAPRPTINQFKKILRRRGYKQQPRERTRYFFRQGSHDSELEEPTFHFFTTEGVGIQQFVGFLIPSIDFGHGARQGRRDLNKAWLSYLREIGEKACQSKGERFKPGIFNKRYLQEIREKALGPRPGSRASKRERFEFEARRIIFFDKRLVHLFLFAAESDSIFEGYESFLRGECSIFAELKYEIVQYVLDMAKIHQAVVGSLENPSPVKCYYLDESQVASNRFYDFGLYVVEGVPIVYVPVCKKDRNRTLEEQKVYIGDTERQRRGIEEFLIDFEKLWDEAKKRALGGGNHSDLYYVDPESEYYKLDAVSLQAFDKGYYRLIREKFEAKGIHV